MATRNTTHVLKNSDIVNRPLPGSLFKGEPIINTADGILYFSGVTTSTNEWTAAGTGTTANFFEVGSNLYDLKLRNQITKYQGTSGSGLIGKFLSGTSTGFVLADISEINGISGFTYNPSTNTFTITDASGDVYDATIQSVTGLTVNGTLSATTVNGDTVNINNLTVTGSATYNQTATSPNDIVNYSTLTAYTQTTDVYVTGSTYSGSVDSSNSTTHTLSYHATPLGGPYTLTGADTYTTGGTYDNNTTTITFKRNDGTSGYTVDLSTIDVNDTYVSGGTVTSGGTLDLFRTDNVTVSVPGVTYWTSGTTGTTSIKAINTTGLDSTGDRSVAWGNQTLASGNDSTAWGVQTSATTIGSTSQGYLTLASGDYSHAEGNITIASGQSSHAEGSYTQSLGSYSHAEGETTTTSGSYSHAEGVGTIASGDGSHAEGYLTIASGFTSHAEGRYTQSLGISSHAEGDGTQANGYASHAEGNSTVASGNYSHVEGYNTKTGGNNGYLAISVASGLVTLDASYGDVSTDYPAGDYLYLNDISYDDSYTTSVFIIDSTSFNGTETEILLVDTSVATSTAVVGNINLNPANWTGDQVYGAPYSHAEGDGTTAIAAASHAEGAGTTASGNYSHAEGEITVAIGDYSHAEGISTQSIGDHSHAEGRQSISSGLYSHAEGESAVAIGISSHAEGNLTVAGWRAFTVTSVVAGLITISDNVDYSSVFNSGEVILDNIRYTNNAVVFTSPNFTIQLDDTTVNSGTYVSDFTNLNSPLASYIAGTGAHATGNGTKALSDFSETGGNLTMASGYGAHAEGDGTSAIGDYSHAEGQGTTSSGPYSHAEGRYTQADGDFSHSEGNYTISSGDSSHAEGSLTQAIGIASHAEGYSTTSIGLYSHSAGYNSISSGNTSFIHSTNSVVGGDRSVVLGGQNITGLTNDTVYVPYLNLNYVPTLNNANTEILSRNSVGGQVEYTPLSAFTALDTYVTGFTYSPSTSTFTIKQNQGQSDLTALIDTMTGLTVTGDAVIEGSLTVFGPSVSAFTSNLYVEDSNITLNYNPTGSTTVTSIGAGWTIQDGSGISNTATTLNVGVSYLNGNLSPNTEYTSTTGNANRNLYTQLGDIIIRNTNYDSNAPDGVRVLAEGDVLDGGTF